MDKSPEVLGVFHNLLGTSKRIAVAASDAEAMALRAIDGMEPEDAQEKQKKDGDKTTATPAAASLLGKSSQSGLAGLHATYMSKRQQYIRELLEQGAAVPPLEIVNQKNSPLAQQPGG